MRHLPSLDAEWLETDGLGGFASGIVSGRRTRRYHALLLAATTPPTGRMVLINGLEVWIEVDGQVIPLSSQHYAPDVLYPRGDEWLEAFTTTPWPRWTYRLPNGIQIEQELLVPCGVAAVAIRWRRVGRLPETLGPLRLVVRPLLSGRDYHALHHENDAFCFAAECSGEQVTWRSYDGVPAVTARSNGDYHHAPDWYRNFFYAQEAARGLDFTEDLASPGEFSWNLTAGEAIWITEANASLAELLVNYPTALTAYEQLRTRELSRRATFANAFDQAADQFLVKRDQGRTIVAGYPWFTDWGRDTFIAMRGLVVATGRLDIAIEILRAWSTTVSEGMLPNRFADRGETPEFNSVDASLWFVIAAHETLKAIEHQKQPLGSADKATILAAIEAILTGYLRGTRYQIHIDDDGLLAAGEPGVQLTWMDAKVGDWVVTPRMGKPVELQSLWLNAVWIAQQWLTPDGQWQRLLAAGQESFRARFWNDERNCLFDVVDVDHRQGAVDATVRPNQIFAIGGLPLCLLDSVQASTMLKVVEAELYTPLGLRSLSPNDAAYQPHYTGDVRSRDGAYHQGTVWPWLIGPYVEAWLRVHGDTPGNRQVARERFLTPLVDHLSSAGLGHLSEIADGEAPHLPRGCPFQAWSLGEFLRLDRAVLADLTLKKQSN